METRLSLPEVEDISKQLLDTLQRLKSLGLQYGPVKCDSIYLQEGTLLLQNQLLLKCRYVFPL